MRACMLLLGAAALTACTTRSPAPNAVTEAWRGSQAAITRGEIARLYHDGTLLDALRGLRPRFLQSRGGTHEVVVYVDNVPVLGGLSDLATMRTSMVDEVLFLTPSEATIRFGTGHMGGAILVALRR